MKQSIVVVMTMLIALIAILAYHRQHNGFNDCHTEAKEIELDFPHPGNGLLISKLLY